MSNPDRSAYEPTYEDDDIDTFDATDEEEEESSGRSPVLIILGLLVLAGFGAVVWMAYEQGKRQSVRAEAPTLFAEQDPIKVAPDNPGGTKVPNTDKIIYDGVNGNNTQTSEQLLPPSETPSTRPQPPVTTTPTTNLGTPSRPTTGTQTPATGSSTSQPANNLASTGANTSATTTKPTTGQAQPTTTKPTVTAEAETPTTAAPQTTQAPATTQPTTNLRPSTVPGPSTTAAQTPSTGQTEAASQQATITAVDPTTVPPATARPTGAGAFVVQVGSYPNDSAAASAWQGIKGKNTTLLAAYKPDVVKADLGAKGTWYRLRVGPFDNRDTANDLCAQLKANGQACIVSKP